MPREDCGRPEAARMTCQILGPGLKFAPFPEIPVRGPFGARASVSPISMG